MNRYLLVQLLLVSFLFACGNANPLPSSESEQCLNIAGDWGTEGDSQIRVTQSGCESLVVTELPCLRGTDIASLLFGKENALLVPSTYAGADNQVTHVDFRKNEIIVVRETKDAVLQVSMTRPEKDRLEIAYAYMGSQRSKETHHYSWSFVPVKRPKWGGVYWGSGAGPVGFELIVRGEPINGEWESIEYKDRDSKTAFTLTNSSSGVQLVDGSTVEGEAATYRGILTNIRGQILTIGFDGISFKISQKDDGVEVDCQRLDRPRHLYRVR